MLLHILAFLGQQIPGMVIGFVAGAFTPSIGRIIKGWFSKKGQQVQSAIKSKL